ncbi:MAG: FUSC family protein [Candidatus Rokuibacteriota bacterium]
MNIWARFVTGDALGIHFAVNVFIATIALWFILRTGANTNPIWAIASMIATSEPQLDQSLLNFRARIINTLLGCTTGMLFLVVGGAREWKLPLALSVTVLLSSYVVRIKTMHRTAPITAALIIASGLEHHTTLSGVEVGIRRVGEVLLGCLVGLLVAWIMSKVWPLSEGAKQAGARKS